MDWNVLADRTPTTTEPRHAEAALNGARDSAYGPNATVMKATESGGGAYKEQSGMKPFGNLHIDGAGKPEQQKGLAKENGEQSKRSHDGQALGGKFNESDTSNLKPKAK